MSATPASDSLPETLSKPTIWAKPNFMIPNGMPVIIWCQGMHEATEYQLYFERQLSALERPNPPGMMNKVKFPIHTMTSNTAGQYRCSYRSGELWSKPSDPLDLVITGNQLILCLQSHSLGLPLVIYQELSLCLGSGFVLGQVLGKRL